jgi:Transaldolase/Fructose-6-phosphate aldolase
MDAELNPAQRLHTLGQSLWLDSINRVMLRTGTLARYVRDLAVTGLTSNPTILGHAMAAGSDYDSSLARLVADGVTDARDPRCLGQPSPGRSCDRRRASSLLPLADGF